MAEKSQGASVDVLDPTLWRVFRRVVSPHVGSRRVCEERPHDTSDRAGDASNTGPGPLP